MNAPTSQQRDIILKWREQESHVQGFVEFCRWVQNQRDEQDAKNRVPGSENRESAAQALTLALEVLGYGSDGERAKQRDLSVTEIQNANGQNEQP